MLSVSSLSKYFSSNRFRTVLDVALSKNIQIKNTFFLHMHLTYCFTSCKNLFNIFFWSLVWFYYFLEQKLCRTNWKEGERRVNIRFVFHFLCHIHPSSIAVSSICIHIFFNIHYMALASSVTAFIEVGPSSIRLHFIC